MADLSEPELLRVLDGAVKVTRAAAVPVMQMFRRSPVVWSKDAQGRRVIAKPEAGRVENPVTEADIAANQILLEGLLPLLPGSAWLSEESADAAARLDADLVWIVDPIDGTREYVEGVPEFAISVALVGGGVPLLAVLYNPAAEDLFTAVRGLGCLRNGQETSVRPVEDLSQAVLLASRTETGRGEFAVFSERMQVRTLGSTAYKLALVAGGEAQVYFTRKPRNEWDVAAGVLLCTEAGATVTDLGGDLHAFNRPDPRCRGVVTALPGLHRQVLDLIHEVGTLE